MARRSMKGGFGETDGLMLPLVLSLLVLAAIVAFIALVPTKKETFVTAPSATGDKKEVTPSGNVILY